MCSLLQTLQQQGVSSLQSATQVSHLSPKRVCSDFLHSYQRSLKATRRCHACGRNFFGDTCFEAHRTQNYVGKPADTPQSNICFTRRKCVGCLKLEVGLKNIRRHRCGYVDCPSCHQYVNAQTHRCYIQRAPTPQEIQERKKERKRQRQRQGGPPAKRGAAAGLQTLQANEEEVGKEKEELRPLHVFFYIEAMQPQEQHVANLVIAETEDGSRPFRFKGEHCLRDFLEWLDTLTLEDTRQVNVIAHNFQGYDGYFVVHQYHSDNQIIEQLGNGCKLIEVKRLHSLH